MNKNQLRSLLRKARRAVTPRQRRYAAAGLQRQVARSRLALRSKRIGFYLAMGEEMDMLPLLNQMLWQGKQCFVPVVPPRFERALNFSRLTAQPRWYLNRYGIYEHWSPRPVRAWQLDLLFVPLVGFDETGYRIGMGGGFYDASLAYLHRRTLWRKPLLIGVGYECQKIARVPHDPWDIRLDAVVTEKRWYWCRPEQAQPAAT
ncbi:MAG: 5-formyltetrahydrofolate cyclo-ligase [Sulfuricellaceae bacterium]